MQDQAPITPDDFEGELPPLDADEQQWAQLLGSADRDLLQDGDAFVAGVMDRLDRERGRAVLARIGGWRPVAAAAAVVLAGLIGWAAVNGGNGANPDNFTGNPGTDNDSALVQAAPDTPDDSNPHIVVDNTPKAQDVEVGRIIADLSRSITAPQITVANPDPSPTRLQRVLQLFENPVDDAARYLPQRAGQDRG